MKKLLCLMISAVVLLSVGCNVRKSESYNSFRIGKVTAFADTVPLSENRKTGFYGFTAKLFSASVGDNMLFAPLPIYTALGMTVNGAANKTLEEMLAAMENTVDDINAVNLAAYKEVTENADKTKVSLANSVWIKDDYGEYVKESYLDKLSAYYSPEVFSLPFNDKALKMINDWAYNNTNGKIDKVIEKFGQDAVMELITALYIKGKWREEAVSLSERTFKNADGSEGKAEYFSGSSALYASERAYAVKRFMEGGYYMLAVLPNEKEDFGKYLSAFDGNELYCLINKTDPRGARYTFPEFESENTLPLIPVLKNMGIMEAFSRYTADFSDMTDDPVGLYIADAEQKAKIKVNRYGLEGSATVKIEMGRKGSAAPPEDEPLRLEFNRPFIYFVCTPNDIPLLSGTVTKL
ncbi:MAG: hypothetical protein IJU84_03155 [Clostridia bacterium]|nr:hypothetical protein [Clostridia bacterium]